MTELLKNWKKHNFQPIFGQTRIFLKIMFFPFFLKNILSSKIVDKIYKYKEQPQKKESSLKGPRIKG